MADHWPPREDLCALIAARRAQGFSRGDAETGELVRAILKRWPHLNPSTAYHLANVGRRRDWSPEPRPRRKESGIASATLDHLARYRASHLRPTCHRCWHMGRMALGPLIERFGPTTPASAVVPLFVCSWCGGRAGAVQAESPTDRATGRLL